MQSNFWPLWDYFSNLSREIALNLKSYLRIGKWKCHAMLSIKFIIMKKHYLLAQYIVSFRTSGSTRAWLWRT